MAFAPSGKWPPGAPFPITGTWASTEPTDTFVGSAAAVSPIGTMRDFDLVPAAWFFTADGAQPGTIIDWFDRDLLAPIIGPWASTEHPDIFAGAGTATEIGVNTLRDFDDVLSAWFFNENSAQSNTIIDWFDRDLVLPIPPGPSGTWHSTEGTDIFDAHGGTLGGSWHSTEADDRFAASGYPQVIGSWHSTEADDI